MPKKGEVLINPRYHFHRPRAVLRAEVLDRQEKIDVLQDWEKDLREEKQPGTRTFRADPSAVGSELGEVRSALERLESGKLDTA
jgi:hypothetical protein